MATLLSTFAVAFAACCVWLTVRIVNRRERWAKWTLAAVVGQPLCTSRPSVPPAGRRRRLIPADGCSQIRHFTSTGRSEILHDVNTRTRHVDGCAGGWRLA